MYVHRGCFLENILRLCEWSTKQYIFWILEMSIMMAASELLWWGYGRWKCAVQFCKGKDYEKERETVTMQWRKRNATSISTESCLQWQMKWQMKKKNKQKEREYCLKTLYSSWRQGLKFFWSHEIFILHVMHGSIASCIYFLMLALFCCFLGLAWIHYLPGDV